MAFLLLLLLFLLSVKADRNPSAHFNFTDLAITTALYSLAGGLILSSIFGH